MSTDLRILFQSDRKLTVGPGTMMEYLNVITNKQVACGRVNLEKFSELVGHPNFPKALIVNTPTDDVFIKIIDKNSKLIFDVNGDTAVILKYDPKKSIVDQLNNEDITNMVAGYVVDFIHNGFEILYDKLVEELRAQTDNWSNPEPKLIAHNAKDPKGKVHNAPLAVRNTVKQLQQLTLLLRAIGEYWSTERWKPLLKDVLHTSKVIVPLDNDSIGLTFKRQSQHEHTAKHNSHY
jgi:hypothetical protein